MRSPRQCSVAIAGLGLSTRQTAAYADPLAMDATATESLAKIDAYATTVLQAQRNCANLFPSQASGAGMPILTARLNELLVMTGINAATLRSDRLRKTSVAAFGADHPVLEERCLLIDGVAMLVRDDLSRDASRAGMPRRGAAMVVRGFFDKWIEAVARIEHRGEDVLFVVAEQAEGIWWCGTGLAAQLPDFIRNQPPRRLFCVNIAAILLAMRSRAEKAGYDLTGGSFFLPPDHELYLQWVKEFRERREVAQQQFDPLHMKPPRSLSVPQRRTIETASCRIN